MAGPSATGCTLQTTAVSNSIQWQVLQKKNSIDVESFNDVTVTTPKQSKIVEERIKPTTGSLFLIFLVVDFSSLGSKNKIIGPKWTLKKKNNNNTTAKKKEERKTKDSILTTSGENLKCSELEKTLLAVVHSTKTSFSSILKWHSQQRWDFRKKKREGTIWCDFSPNESVIASKQVFPAYPVEGGKLWKRSVDFLRHTENKERNFQHFSFSISILKDRWISTTSLAIADYPTWTVTPWLEQEPSNHRAALITWRTTASMIPSSFASSRNWKAASSRPSTLFSKTLAPSMIAASSASPHPTVATLSITLTLARTCAVLAITLWPLWPTFRYSISLPLPNRRHQN